MNGSWSFGVVAFIDILGFSAIVEADARVSKPTKLWAIHELLANVQDTAPMLDVRAFSDSITISAHLDSAMVTQLLVSVVDLQRKFTSNGVLVRGGIAFGKHFSDATLIYSEAMIRAYLLERDKARFPRVLIDKDLLDWYFHNLNTQARDAKVVESIILTDRDDYVFVDYLDTHSLETHLHTINAYDVKKATPSVLEKVQWLCHYHNFKAEKCASQCVYVGSMLNGFRSHAVQP